jgi:hypothetical protein
MGFSNLRVTDDPLAKSTPGCNLKIAREAIPIRTRMLEARKNLYLFPTKSIIS